VLWLAFTHLFSLPAAAQPLLLVQDDLADLRPGDVTGLDWITTPAGALLSRFCAAPSARIMLTSRTFSRRERDACAIVDGQIVEQLIGRRAVIAIGGGASFALTSAILYRALADNAASRATRWRQLDASLPDAPLHILLPPTGSIEDRILRDIVLYDGCSASVAALPADPVKRLAACTTIRNDASVMRLSGKQTTTAWLHSQGSAAVALIGVATLLAEPELETALPLDGVQPSFANIADGHYRAALPVWFVTVIAPDTASPIAGVAGTLLAETSIGPLGKLPRRGLAPLEAAARVRLRATLGHMFESAD
jgi:phosphate transport system substrate-binding protein